MWFTVTQGALVLANAVANHLGPPATGTASAGLRFLILIVTGNDPGVQPL
jgi:hypothetical protein